MPGPAGAIRRRPFKLGLLRGYGPNEPDSRVQWTVEQADLGEDAKASSGKLGASRIAAAALQSGAQGSALEGAHGAQLAVDTRHVRAHVELVAGDERGEVALGAPPARMEIAAALREGGFDQRGLLRGVRRVDLNDMAET